MQRFFLTLGALSGFAAVTLGAFAAHGLKNQLSPQSLAIFHTGVDYQMYHSLALLIAAGLFSQHSSASQQPSAKLLTLSSASFTLGILLFSGSLYALALGAPPVLGIITPFGGLAFLLGWAALALHAYSR